MSHALVVDDDVDAANALAALIAGENFTVATAHSLRDARRQIVLQQPDIVLMDLTLPDGNGTELFTSDAALISSSEVVLVTGHAGPEIAVEALRLGAADYLVKPVKPRHLQGVLSRLMKPATLQAEVADLSATVASSGRFGHLWGRAPAMLRVYEQIARVAGTGVTVFITGESGSGKEVVAQTVHDLSRRRKKPFLAVNCGAVSPNLIESEIFGHEKGSFTGAERQHQGFFERADGGTLFLDEITEMPAELQVKLLRVLETGRYMRVGSTTSQEADVRVIAATNRDPLRAVAEGKLREDLLYRLNVFPIELPPLRDRLQDVPLLADQFLAAIGEQEGSAKHFTPEALSQLSAWPWPGNVRELRNAVQRAYVMALGDSIDGQWLPRAEPAGAASAGLATGRPAVVPCPAGLWGGRTEAAAAALTPADRAGQPGPWAPAQHAAPAAPSPAPVAQAPAGGPGMPAPAPPAPAPGGQVPGVPVVTLTVGVSLADAERQLILATLAHCRQHKERTAAMLGISLKTLYNRLKAYAAEAGRTDPTPDDDDHAWPPANAADLP